MWCCNIRSLLQTGEPAWSREYQSQLIRSKIPRGRRKRYIGDLDKMYLLSTRDDNDESRLSSPDIRCQALGAFRDWILQLLVLVEKDRG